jgi:hypothetical protein
MTFHLAENVSDVLAIALASESTSDASADWHENNAAA